MPNEGDLQFVIGVLNKFVEKHVKIITLDATANLIEDTPVKTGWARSNWIPSIGEGAAPDVSIKEPDAADVNGRKAEQQSGLSEVVNSYKLPAPVLISNNVPYINRLNDGHSQQAPSGFVQSAVLRAVRDAFGESIEE